MHVLITGHTGFKGAWLTLLLIERGHSVSGLALDPVPDGVFVRAEVAPELAHDVRTDIRDAQAVRSVVAEINPDAVIHMAAQPLVRVSLEEPRTTFETNVMGTLNVLEACAATSSVAAQIVVTTDKVYRNVNQTAGYKESDPLGGDDPYSASKAMTELLVHAWRSSFPGCPTATARAGNVIGGGDVSRDRLVPDLIAAMAAHRPAVIRYPDAVRPWQHVLDAVNGYTVLLDALMSGSVQDGSWNFGPEADSFLTVGEVADRVAVLWGGGADWQRDTAQHPHEAQQLTLDASLARRLLGWRARLELNEALAWTVDWERSERLGGGAASQTRLQIRDFEAIGTPGP